MGDIHDSHGWGGQVQGAQLIRGGYVIVQCIVVWDGGGDSGQDLFGIRRRRAGQPIEPRPRRASNVCCIRLCPGATSENVEFVTDMDFVVECTNHCMDTERSGCE